MLYLWEYIDDLNNPLFLGNPQKGGGLFRKRKKNFFLTTHSRVDYRELEELANPNTN